jgi:hypothetical protein
MGTPLSRKKAIAPALRAAPSQQVEEERKQVDMIATHIYKLIHTDRQYENIRNLKPIGSRGARPLQPLSPSCYF